MAADTKWQNGAALPNAADQAAQAYNDPSERSKRNILRKRYLTPAGTFVTYAVPANANNVTVKFLRPEADLFYGVIATASWVTAISASNKTTTSVLLNFGTTNPNPGTVDLIIFRQET